MDASLDSLLMLGGGGACAVVGVNTAWGIWDRQTRRRQRLRRAADDREKFRQRVVSVATQAANRHQQQGLAWEGLRELVVSAVVDECDRVKSFYLASPDGRSLPTYLPGQYLALHLPVASQSKPLVRCYSLSDRPHEEYYRLTIKECPAPADEPHLPPGVGSTLMHEHVQVGDTLKVAAPRGEFFLEPTSDEPVVLIAGGIGVTPILSMLEAQVHHGNRRDAHLLLGMRNGNEYPFKERLKEITSTHDCIQAWTAYSQPEESDAAGIDYQLRGRIDIEAIKSVLPSSNYRFYLCGPPTMMEALVPALLDWGVPDDKIYFEAFGPASVVRASSTTAAKAAVGTEVSFASSAKTATWTETDKTLLDVAERMGVPMDAGCRVGNCGACRTPMVEGQVATVKTPGMKVDDGECLTCVSVPTEALVLDA